MYIIVRRWLYGTIATLVLLAGGYAAYAVRSIPRGGGPTGYALGIAGTLLILALMLLPLRKRQYRRSAGRLDVWMRAHVCLGLVCGAVAGMHAGFTVAGTISIGLTVVFVLTLLSGLAGTYLYERLPRAIAKGSERAMDQDVLRTRLNEVQQELEAIRAARSDRFQRALAREIAQHAAPRSLHPAHLVRWAAHRLFPGGKNVQPEAFSETERAAYRSARALVIRQGGLGRKLFYQQALRQWLWAHMPLSAALCTLLLVHIVFELYY